MTDFLEPQIWSIQAGFKFNYPPCCIYQFVNDLFVDYYFPETIEAPYPASRLTGIKHKYNRVAREKTAVSYWICCYDCSIINNDVISFFKRKIVKAKS